METINPQLQKLTPEERELLAKYFIRKTMKGTMFGAMAGNTDAATIGQAIENQRAYAADTAKRESEEAALKAKAKAEHEAAMKALRDVVTVALVSKKVAEEHGMSGMLMDRRLEITVAYRNNGTKDIAGVKGALVVSDLFGDELSTFRISNDSTIRVGGSTIWSGGRSLQFNMGQNKDEKFAELPEDKYKVQWEPEVIVFTDGTKLSALK
ncbi:hypothetical protein ACFPOE_11450 [Caenimonas terrae]|uniref:Uncharacterized protein n=1 Tax=Caenimonas terrae TaxID=696074 RepID=A0ABW0NGK7_9BURK